MAAVRPVGTRQIEIVTTDINAVMASITVNDANGGAPGTQLLLGTGGFRNATILWDGENNLGTRLLCRSNKLTLVTQDNNQEFAVITPNSSIIAGVDLVALRDENIRLRSENNELRNALLNFQSKINTEVLVNFQNKINAEVNARISDITAQVNTKIGDITAKIEAEVSGIQIGFINVDIF